MGKIVIECHALAEGLTDVQLKALADWRPSTLFDATERAVLAYTDAITDHIKVSEDISPPCDRCSTAASWSSSRAP